MTNKSLKELEQQVNFWIAQQRLRLEALSHAREFVYQAEKDVEKAEEEYIKANNELRDFINEQYRNERNTRG